MDPADRDLVEYLQALLEGSIEFWQHTKDGELHGNETVGLTLDELEHVINALQRAGG